MKQDGFTLVEVLVSIVILVLVMAVIYGAMESVTSTAAVARAGAQELHMRQFLQQNFAGNLSSLYADAGCTEPEYQLLGEDDDLQDYLRFCTSLPLSGASALPGVLKVVTYEVTAGSDDDLATPVGALTLDQVAPVARDLVLRVTEQALVLGEAGDIGEGKEAAEKQANDLRDGGEEGEVFQEYTIPVASMDIKYFDGEEWLDDWDSLELTRMPWAVRVMINFPRTEEELEAAQADGYDLEESPDFDFTSTIPIGAGTWEQFIDQNHARSVEIMQEQPMNAENQNGTGTGGSGTNNGGATGGGSR